MPLIQPTMLLRILALSSLVASADGATHYTCIDDEVAGELMGETGVVCAPKCKDGTSECPTDVPDGTTAQPQCMLTDVDKVGYCGLLCDVDTQCPSGGVCWHASPVKAGLCVHPLSFTEWSRLDSKRKKLDVSLPAAGATGQSPQSSRLAKASEALLKLKQRFGIADGDADILTVQEMISAARSIDVAAISSVASQPQSAAQTLPPPSSPAARGKPGADMDSVLGPWKHDISYLAGNVQQGIPGLQREISDTVWNVEHLQNPGVAYGLLRGVILIALVYVVSGSAIKYHSMGARGIEMIPHQGFWMEYPNLVLDGVSYAKILVSGLMGQQSVRTFSGGGGGGFQGGRNHCERDNLGNFEPTL